MNEKMSLKDLFISWESFNSNISESFNSLDFSSVRDVRNKQREIEDIIYASLLENAPEDLKQILPEDCGEMEIGYDIGNEKFYFLMEDPFSDPEEEELKILAITIDTDSKVETIKDFHVDED